MATTTPTMTGTDKPDWPVAITQKQHLLNQTNRMERLMDHWITDYTGTFKEYKNIRSADVWHRETHSNDEALFVRNRALKLIFLDSIFLVFYWSFTYHDMWCLDSGLPSANLLSNEYTPVWYYMICQDLRNICPGCGCYIERQTLYSLCEILNHNKRLKIWIDHKWLLLLFRKNDLLICAWSNDKLNR